MQTATRDAATAPKGCTNLKMRQLGRLVSRHYEAFLAPAGLRGTQYSLLSHVVTLGPLRLGELAKVMQMDASTLSRNLQPLLDRGLARVDVGEDARSRVVQVTVAGQALRRDSQQAWKRAQLALNLKLGSQRVATLHTLIDECRGLLAPEGAEDE